MSFPLAEWIDRHQSLPHNLGRSGFRGELRSRDRALRRRPESDPEALRRSLARLHGVAADRVFLTHGASEGNFLALSYLARRGRGGLARPKLRRTNPEYPPLFDVARWLGYTLAGPRLRPGEVYIRSEPNNPLGTQARTSESEPLERHARAVVLDETYREIGGRASRARLAERRVWVSGTFTKVYGADDQRVGFVVPPPEEAEGFGRFHGLATDQLPPPSVSAARALLAHREEVLAEARGIFRSNLKFLRESFPDVPELLAPLWFDRGGGPGWGDRAAHAAVRHGILVCSGRFFGDGRGVRVCLTRRSFPEDLSAYVRFRRRVAGRPFSLPVGRR